MLETVHFLFLFTFIFRFPTSQKHIIQLKSTQNLCMVTEFFSEQPLPNCSKIISYADYWQ
jgi:hypothetical protein